MTPPALHRRVLLGLAMACIAAQLPSRFLSSLGALLVWIVALALLDRESVAKLWMPRFWTVTLVLALGSGILLGRPDLDVLGFSLSLEGLEAGGTMVVRGAFVFGLTSWAGRGLGGPDFQRWAARVHLAPLGDAIAVALSLLPELQVRLRQVIATAPKSRSRFSWLEELSIMLLCESSRLAERLSRRDAPAVFAVVGPKGSGKSTVIEELALELSRSGIRVGGVLQPAIVREGVRSGYSLLDLTTGERRPFAHPSEGLQTGMGYRFEEEGWSWPRQRILQALAEREVVVVDELGRLEADGKGHLPALLTEAEPHSSVWVLGVRADCAGQIEQRLGGFAGILRSEGSREERREFLTTLQRTVTTARGGRDSATS